MAKPSEKEIAARAYKLWEQNGQPEGRDESSGVWPSNSC